MESICTCTHKTCPNHPTKHDKGCTPCINKNLKAGEIPDCFFNLVTDHMDEIQDYTIQGFAKIVSSKNQNVHKN